MKKIMMLGFGLMLTAVSCKKEYDKVSKEVEISYPTVTVKGAKFVTLNVGGTFVDEGATVIDDITGGQSTVMGENVSDLNTSRPGLYSVTYSAANANGYVSTAARYVAVTNYPDDVNLSGRYQRQAAAPNNRFVTLTRMSRALYRTSDIGGAGLGDTGYFAVLDTNKIDFGRQWSETLGTYISGSNSFLRIRPGDTSYAYALAAAGYGTAQRIFRKVP